MVASAPLVVGGRTTAAVLARGGGPGDSGGIISRPELATLNAEGLRIHCGCPTEEHKLANKD
uniref:Uncharacterized protein n=2 Tax=Oryza TaxID=4527 RepID=Q6Z1I7_ORYSJ|nr:hypothetical protein [Oryza sativa Japonica Group]BAD03585.1 hypothetical protein [Oryza sativa Japonica Group]